MGIDGGWKQKMATVFGWPAMTQEEATKIDYIEDDLSLNLRRVLGGVDTWEMLGSRIRDRVSTFLNTPGVVQYRIVIDDPRYVPRSKGLEQQRRDSTAQNKEFSEQERQHIRIGHGDIPLPTPIFFERLLATRSMRHELFAFIVAELALVEMKPGKRLVIDGACATAIAKYEQCGANVRITNASMSSAEAAEAAAIGDALPAPTLDLANATTITVTPREDGSEGNDVFVNPNSRIAGEGDMKIPDGIAMTPRGACIFVRSCDTDMIPILLLHMRRWMGAGEDEDGEPRYNVLLDTNGAIRNTKNSKPILNVTKLWRVIADKFLRDFTWVKHGVETLAALMLLSGSDFVKMWDGEVHRSGMPAIGPSAVWETFCSPQGRAILFPQNVKNAPHMVVETVYGDTVAHLEIGLAEDRWRSFVACMYLRLVFPSKPFPVVTDGSLGLDAARKERRRVYDAAVKSGAKLTHHNKWQVPEDAAIAVLIRQVAWNLDYDLNGASEYPFLDPFCATDQGVSIYGWVRDDQGKVHIADHVYIV